MDKLYCFYNNTSYSLINPGEKNVVIICQTITSVQLLLWKKIVGRKLKMKCDIGTDIISGIEMEQSNICDIKARISEVS